MIAKYASVRLLEPAYCQQTVRSNCRRGLLQSDCKTDRSRTLYLMKVNSEVLGGAAVNLKMFKCAYMICSKMSYPIAKGVVKKLQFWALREHTGTAGGFFIM